MKIFLIPVLLMLSFNIHAADLLSASNAWIPEAPPVARVMAGYLELKNNSERSIELKSITAKDFERVEMHETISKDGVAKMIKQTSIKIPAQGRVSFKRGGLHLMLMGPRRKLKRGDSVTLILKTDETNTEINLIVKEATLDDHSAHH